MAGATKFRFTIKSEPDKEKAALLYVEFALDTRYKLSLGEFVKPQWWNTKLRRAIVIEGGEQKQADTRNAKRVNKFLDALEKDLLDLFERFKDWKRVKPNPISKPIQYSIVDSVKEKIKKYHKKEEEEIVKRTKTPTKFFQEYIDGLSNKVNQRTGTLVSAGTITNHKIVLKRFKNFLSHNRYVDSFDIFDKYFEGKLEAFLLKELGYTPNTVCATNSILKVWLKEAEKEGLIKDTTSYKSMKSKGPTVEHIYLNDEELQRIYDIQFTDDVKNKFKIDSKSNIEETRDLFMIAAKTGLRLGDLARLNTSTWDLDKRTLTINTHKTQKRIVIPLADIVVEIYNKYEGKFPLPADKSHYNRHIERCAMMAGIDEDIYVINKSGGEYKEVYKKKWQLVRSHTARRSFATNMYLKCGDAHLVMSITGHTTEENFLKYICVTKEQNAERARQFI